MTPAPPYDVIVDVRLAPVSCLVGQASIDGLWSETQPSVRAWRAARRPSTLWKPEPGAARVGWAPKGK
jgi:hypothetical protein